MILLNVSRSLRSPLNKYYHRARGLHGERICKSILQETALKGILKNPLSGRLVLDILKLRVIGPLSKNYHTALSYDAIIPLKRPTLSRGLHVDPRNTDVQWT